MKVTHKSVTNIALEDERERQMLSSTLNILINANTNFLYTYEKSIKGIDWSGSELMDFLRQLYGRL